jgi:hypothetical protein
MITDPLRCMSKNETANSRGDSSGSLAGSRTVAHGPRTESHENTIGQ